MLSKFAMKKETFSDRNKQNISKFKKSHFMLYARKISFSSLFRFDQNKTKNIAF